ncbi:MAG: hypothetical protein ACJ71K_03930 [Nitrososphaeraceae archaeon]|jgi:hypothetical protein
MNATFIVVAGIVIFLIGISAAVWGNITAGADKCSSFNGSLTQLLHNERGQCAYRGEAIGIGIVLLIMGIVVIIVGANSKEKEHTIY